MSIADADGDGKDEIVYGSMAIDDNGAPLWATQRYPAMIGLAAVIPIGQSLASRWWLTRYRYGPVEWLWRSATCWTWPNNRRDGHSELPVRLPRAGGAQRPRTLAPGS